VKQTQIFYKPLANYWVRVLSLLATVIVSTMRKFLTTLTIIAFVSLSSYTQSVKASYLNPTLAETQYLYYLNLSLLNSQNPLIEVLSESEKLQVGTDICKKMNAGIFMELNNNTLIMQLINHLSYQRYQEINNYLVDYKAAADVIAVHTLCPKYRYQLSNILNNYATSKQKKSVFRTVYAKDGYANLRSGPSTKMSIFSLVLNGMHVRVLDQQKNKDGQLWYKVIVNNQVGWIYSRLLY
jgi:hypothetical protein